MFRFAHAPPIPSSHVATRWYSRWGSPQLGAWLLVLELGFVLAALFVAHFSSAELDALDAHRADKVCGEAPWAMDSVLLEDAPCSRQSLFS